MPGSDFPRGSAERTQADVVYGSRFLGGGPHRGYLGHFDPSSGKQLKKWPSPGGSESKPYGIATTNDGEAWYSESGMKPNTLVSFDPRSESFSTRPIPSGGGVVRNMVATPDRRFYLAYSGVNKVAVVDLNRDDLSNTGTGERWPHWAAQWCTSAGVNAPGTMFLDFQFREY